MAASIYELSFTPDDLEANRQGNLTDAQREKLDVFARQQRQNIGWGVIIFALLIAAAIGFEFLRAGGTLELFARRQTPLVLILVGVFLLILITLTITTQINLRPLKKGMITRLEGKAKIDEIVVANRSQNYTLYQVIINKTVFRFYQEASRKHFENGRTYRVYLVKMRLFPTPIPLSAERIR